MIPIPKQGLVDRKAAGTLRRLLDDGRIDLIHAHNGRTSLAAALAVRQSRRGRAMASQHFLTPDHASRTGALGMLYRRAHHWVNAQLAHTIAISQAVGEEMLARGEVPPGKITVVPNGVQAPDVSQLKCPAAVREELGIPMGAPLIVCVARLEREKDVPSLIEAMAAVSRVCPAARCVVAGEGSQQSALERQIDGLGVRHAVRLLGFREDALAIVHAGDFFVLPSLAEPSGLAILEAMALGKAVVTTHAGGPREIVVDGTTGLLVPPTDPAALAHALLTLIHEPTVREAMGERGLQRFQERYTDEHMSRATLEVYQRVLGGS